MEVLDRCSSLSRSGESSRRIPISLSWCSRQEKNGYAKRRSERSKRTTDFKEKYQWQKNVKGKAGRTIKHMLVSPFVSEADSISCLSVI